MGIWNPDGREKGFPKGRDEYGRCGVGRCGVVSVIAEVSIFKGASKYEMLQH